MCTVLRCKSEIKIFIYIIIIVQIKFKVSQTGFRKKKGTRLSLPISSIKTDSNPHSERDLNKYHIHSKFRSSTFYKIGNLIMPRENWIYYCKLHNFINKWGLGYSYNKLLFCTYLYIVGIFFFVATNWWVLHKSNKI